MTAEDARLVLQDDGRLTIRTASDRVLWSAGRTATEMQAGAAVNPNRREETVLPAGGWITSPDGRYTLTLQRDGNLVLRGPAGRLAFATRTSGGPDSVFVAQADGNLVVYDEGRPVWASGTAQPRDSDGPSAFSAVLQNDGRLVQYVRGDPARVLWSSPAPPGPPCLGSAIRARWLSLGGALHLGQPLVCEAPTPHKPGRHAHFEGGSIYWSRGTGAWEVHGPIREKWAALGWENGFLGFPTTGVNPLDGGAFSRFQGGQIYSGPAGDGAFEVHGSIFQAWGRTGWENGPLGYPMTDELPTPTKPGRYNHFQGGSVYWSPSTGAFPVENGPIRDLWAALGWEDSALGFPTSSSYRVPAPGGETWTRQDFQAGPVTSSTEGGAALGLTPPR